MHKPDRTDKTRTMSSKGVDSHYKPVEKISAFDETLLRTIPFGMDIVDEQGNILFLNAKLKSIFGENAIGKKCWDLYRDDKKQCGNCPIKQPIEIGETSTIETSGALSGKSLQITHTGMLYEGKKAILEIFEDITERKKSEEEIKKAKEYAELIFTVTPSAIFTVDKERRVTSWNKRAEEVTGFSAQEIIGKECLEFAQEPCKGKCGLFSSDCQMPIAGKECTIKTKDGKIRIISKNADLLKDEKGNVVGGIESFEDITEQKKDEEAIRKLSVAIEQSPSPVAITDTKGNLEYVNHKFSQLTGYSLDEVKGQNPRILKSGEQPLEVYKQMWETIASGREWRGEFHNKRKDGGFYWELASISPIRNSKGTITHFLKVAEDITERKRSEEELRKTKDELEIYVSNLNKTNESMKELYSKLEEQNKELKALDQLKSDFVSTVSHELRTPLTVIREGVSLINDKVLGEVSDQQSEILRDILESTDRLAKIINDLLDISKLEAGKIDLEQTEVDTASLIKKLVKDFQIKAKPKEITLKEELPEKVSYVFGDYDRLIQVLTNLVGNAIKFTPNKGTITIAAKESAADMVEISVSDSGRGIAKDDASKLFDKFSQFGRTPGPGEKGTGLGLAIAKNIVELHGGKIWAESELEKGSTFFITVPKYEAPEVMAVKMINKQLESIHGTEEDFSLIMLNVINMSSIQTSLGESAYKITESKLLSIVRENASRPGDTILPYHFGEIVVALSQTDEKGALVVCDRIRDAVETTRIEFGDHSINAKIKFGIACFPKDGKSAQELLRAAEAEFSRKKKILVVDDHPQIVRLLTHRLASEAKFECIQAFDGEEAIMKARKEMPDLIICDIVMPKMNGYEVLGNLKEDEKTRDIPFIILTAHNVKSEKIKTVYPGSVPVLTKTEGFEHLMEVVHKLI
ncbi:PAS domain S-box protein [Candidatus Omnitrophota bacterium]